jgi:LPS export ABC transporter protein LptC
MMGGCQDEIPTPVASPELLASGADQVMTGLEHVITLNGVKEGVVKGDTAFLYSDSTMAVLVSPVLELFTETGVLRARVTARNGRYNTDTKDLSAYGDVVLVITEGNRRVESSELHYEPGADRIWSDSMTVMNDGGVVSRGMGFTSDLQFRQTRVGPGSIRGSGSGGIRF